MSVDVTYCHARDISDAVFCASVLHAQHAWTRRAHSGQPGRLYSALRWDVERVLAGRHVDYSIDEPPPRLSEADQARVPWKVVLAKFRRCAARGLVDGCGCGCRGDWELTDKGRTLLATADVDALLPPVTPDPEVDPLMSVSTGNDEALSGTQSAELAAPKVPGPVNCTTDDPLWNVAHLIVLDNGDGTGTSICGQVLRVADHPSKHVDCTCAPFPQCAACVTAKLDADARKAAMAR